MFNANFSSISAISWLARNYIVHTGGNDSRKLGLKELKKKLKEQLKLAQSKLSGSIIMFSPKFYSIERRY